MFASLSCTRGTYSLQHQKKEARYRGRSNLNKRVTHIQDIGSMHQHMAPHRAS
jgi:hypothetical protein